jgi:hypothetical protein
MADRATQETRAKAREARRAAAKPAPDEVDLEEGVEAVKDDPAHTLRAAASAALAAAAVEAAQAIARRRHSGEEGEEPEEAPAEPEPEAFEEERPEPDQPPRDETVDEREEQEHAPEEEPEREPRPAVAPGDARRIVDRAREQLRDLRGADPESVSSVRRTQTGWCVRLEVVEVRRIPESTDVLGSYEVELDGDGNLVTFERTARYYRSEAERR